MASAQSAVTSVDVLVLPASGDIMTVAPVAVRNSPIAVDVNCGFAPTDPSPDLVVNPSTIEFSDPFTPDRACQVPLPPLPNGTFRAVAVLVSPTCVVNGTVVTNCRSPRSTVALPTPFSVQRCDAFSVSVAVGSWTKTTAPGDAGQVTYSLLNSLNPVTLVIVRMNGIEQDRLTGSDLRKVAGSYFKAPIVEGSYALSVEAQDAQGCSDGASRPMTVKVQRR